MGVPSSLGSSPAPPSGAVDCLAATSSRPPPPPAPLLLLLLLGLLGRIVKDGKRAKKMATAKTPARYSLLLIHCDCVSIQGLHLSKCAFEGWLHYNAARSTVLVQWK